MHLPINSPSSSDSLFAPLTLSITPLCAPFETSFALRMSATSYSSFTTLHSSTASFSTFRSFSLNSRKVTESETCPAMAKTVLAPSDPRRARTAFTSVVNLTSSTSYFLRASSGDRGRPDQITSSGSMGGMNSVERSEAMS